MHVSLLEDIKSLGPKGATVDVPDGYALNFLFPQHLAVKVSDTLLTDKEEARQLKSVKAVPVSAEQSLASDIDGLEVVVPVRVKGGKIVTPVTATEVRAALKELGYKVPKSALHMKSLNTLGPAEVQVVFESGFEAMIQVIVEAQT